MEESLKACARGCASDFLPWLEFLLFAAARFLKTPAAETVFLVFLLGIRLSDFGVAFTARPLVSGRWACIAFVVRGEVGKSERLGVKECESGGLEVGLGSDCERGKSAVGRHRPSPYRTTPTTNFIAYRSTSG
jgi:hypothetical protein